MIRFFLLASAFVALVSGSSATALSTSLHVAPNGDDSGSCSLASPCKTFGRALAVASPGDLVEVAAGVYPEQRIPAGSKAVVFRGADGAVVRGLDNQASDVTVDNVDLDGAGARVTVLRAEGDRQTYRNLSVGDNVDLQSVTNAGAFNVYENVLFHDAVALTDGTHMECLWSDGPNLTIRDSVFRDCAVLDVFVTRGTWWGQPHYGGVVLEGNDFGPSRRENNSGTHFHAVGVHDGLGGIDGWTVRDNAFALPFNDNGQSYSDTVTCGNTGAVADTWRVPCDGSSPPAPAPPPPPPPVYAPACAPSCDERIASLEADLAAALDRIAKAKAALG